MSVVLTNYTTIKRYASVKYDCKYYTRTGSYALIESDYHYFKSIAEYIAWRLDQTRDKPCLDKYAFMRPISKEQIHLLLKLGCQTDLTYDNAAIVAGRWSSINIHCAINRKNPNFNKPKFTDLISISWQMDSDEEFNEYLNSLKEPDCIANFTVSDDGNLTVQSGMVNDVSASQFVNGIPEPKGTRHVSTPTFRGDTSLVREIALKDTRDNGRKTNIFVDAHSNSISRTPASSSKQTCFCTSGSKCNDIFGSGC